MSLTTYVPFSSNTIEKDPKRICAEWSNKFTFPIDKNLDESPRKLTMEQCNEAMEQYSSNIILTNEYLANIIFSYLLKWFHAKTIVSCKLVHMRLIKLMSSGNYIKEHMILPYKLSSSETPFVRLIKIWCAKLLFFYYPEFLRILRDWTWQKCFMDTWEIKTFSFTSHIAILWEIMFSHWKMWWRT